MKNGLKWHSPLRKNQLHNLQHTNQRIKRLLIYKWELESKIYQKHTLGSKIDHMVYIIEI